MNSRLPRQDRSDRIDYVSRELAPGAALLTRLLARQVVSELSRTEAGLLRTLRGGPRRITELAELEGLAQPTTTLLVQRLEQQRLVARQGDPQDGRVVLVNLTETGSRELDDYRAQACLSRAEGSRVGRRLDPAEPDAPERTRTSELRVYPA